MKIILASDLSFLLKFGYGLTGITKDQMKIGYVTTASKGARKFNQRVQETIMPEIKENGFGVTDFTALNYVPFVLKVHYKDESEELVKEKTKTLKYPLRILRDDQGILVENRKCTFVGDNDEVKINND